MVDPDGGEPDAVSREEAPVGPEATGGADHIGKLVSEPGESQAVKGCRLAFSPNAPQWLDSGVEGDPTEIAQENDFAPREECGREIGHGIEMKLVVAQYGTDEQGEVARSRPSEHIGASEATMGTRAERKLCRERRFD